MKEMWVKILQWNKFLTERSLSLGDTDDHDADLRTFDETVE